MPKARRVGLAVALGLLCLPAARAGETTAAEPLFNRNVVPLLSRLGCNAGICHGAVQGKGGLRLSLFGVDPLLDHERLLKEAGGRRLNRADPDSSLVLLKATAQVPHEGGKRLEDPRHRRVRPHERPLAKR